MVLNLDLLMVAWKVDSKVYELVDWRVASKDTQSVVLMG